MANDTTGTEVSTGNGESPQQRSLWVTKVEHIIRIKKEVVQSSSDLYILKVPEYNRQPPTQYTPSAWRFGLHNREDLDITGSEGAKLAVVAGYQFADDVDGIKRFCEAVVPDPKSMLVCYGLHEMVPKLDEEEIQQVLAFDALFLASRIDMEFPDPRMWTTEYGEMTNEELFLPVFDRWKGLVDDDLCKIENQIPFDLIKRAIEHINPSYEVSHDLDNDENSETNPLDKDEDHPLSDANGEQVQGSALGKQTQVATPNEGFVKRIMKCFKIHLTPGNEGKDLATRDVASADIPYLEQWMRQAVYLGSSSFMDSSTDGFFTNANANMELSQSHHILDAAYKAICGVDGTQRTPDTEEEGYIHVPPATKLKQSGIKIVGVAGPLCTMSYDPKTKQLSLPKMNMFDETVSIIRNIARYEEYLDEDKCMFHDYIYLMLDLVDTAEDFKFLSTKCGVIGNECGSRAYEMFDALDQNLAGLQSSKEHNAMKIAIKKRCNMRRYRMWSEFKTLFLSRPWLTLSAIAAVLVTVATLIQTYASVISTNGMKPHFNN